MFPAGNRGAIELIYMQMYAPTTLAPPRDLWTLRYTTSLEDGNLVRSAKMTEPSKVIHVRNVGHEISESDLLQLVHPFGVVTKLVTLRAKDQPLLQMQDMASAVNATGFRYVMGAAASTVYYNLKLRHPTLDMPLIDNDLALLFQLMLMLGISIGVAFNVVFPSPSLKQVWFMLIPKKIVLFLKLYLNDSLQEKATNTFPCFCFFVVDGYSILTVLCLF